MLKPAFAIFSMVASCRLPLGNPKRNFGLTFIDHTSQMLFGAAPGVFRGGLFHANIQHSTPNTQFAIRFRVQRVRCSTLNVECLPFITPVSQEPPSACP